MALRAMESGRMVAEVFMNESRNQSICMLHQTQRTSALAAEKKFRESMKSICFWSQSANDHRQVQLPYSSLH